MASSILPRVSEDEDIPYAYFSLNPFVTFFHIYEPMTRECTLAWQARLHTTSNLQYGIVCRLPTGTRKVLPRKIAVLTSLRTLQ